VDQAHAGKAPSLGSNRQLRRGCPRAEAGTRAGGTLNLGPGGSGTGGASPWDSPAASGRAPRGKPHLMGRKRSACVPTFGRGLGQVRGFDGEGILWVTDLCGDSLALALGKPGRSTGIRALVLWWPRTRSERWPCRSSTPLAISDRFQSVNDPAERARAPSAGRRPLIRRRHAVGSMPFCYL